MNLYLQVFGNVSLRDIDLFKKRRSDPDITYETLAEFYGLPRQRAYQIVSRIENKINEFVALLKKRQTERAESMVKFYTEKLKNI